MLPLGVMLKDKSPSELAAVSELMELGHTIDIARVRKDTNWSEFVRFPHEALCMMRSLTIGPYAKRSSRSVLERSKMRKNKSVTIADVVKDECPGRPQGTDGK